MQLKNQKNILIYDGECFFCANYVRLTKLRESIGNIELINARNTELVKEYAANPSDLNEGILLILGEERYFGADAIHRIALLSTENDNFNKLNRMIFKHEKLTFVLYPAMKLGRRLYLFLAGKSLIK